MIYFCIPALNEERTVGVVLWKLRQIMTELQRDFQIILVDDASTDSTQDVLGPYTRVLPLTLIRNQSQLGYAASMEIAIREAVRRSPYPKRDALITLQADFTEDPDCVPALIKRIEAGADLVGTTPTFDDATPPNIRRGRKFFSWLVRGREWSQFGDPFCGIRAYRVMTVKRAIETRGTSRLLTWEGVAANAELLVQSLPHSRRNDVIEATIHYKRLQRPSRFRFFGVLPQVMGMRSGKPGKAVPVDLPESTIVVPAALAVELATGHQEHRRRGEHRRPGSNRNEGRGPRRERDSTSNRGRERTARGDTQNRQPREPRPVRESRPPREPRAPKPPRQAREPRLETQTELPVEPVLLDENGVAVPAPEREKRRRRPRRRSRKPRQQQGDATNGTEAVSLPDGGEPVLLEAASGTDGEGEAGAPRKKSRRGRRGGRGRRRSGRPTTGEETTSTESDGAAPEMQSEGA